MTGAAPLRIGSPPGAEMCSTTAEQPASPAPAPVGESLAAKPERSLAPPARGRGKRLIPPKPAPPKSRSPVRSPVPPAPEPAGASTLERASPAEPPGPSPEPREMPAQEDLLPVETPRTMLEHKLRSQAAERKKMSEQMADQSSLEPDQEPTEGNQRDVAAHKLEQMRIGIRKVGANLRSRRKTHKAEDASERASGFEAQMKSKLSNFKQEMQDRNSRLEQQHEQIQQSASRVGSAFEQLREEQSREREEHQRHLREMETRRTEQLEQELRAARDQFELERQAKEQAHAKLKLDAQLEQMELRNEQEEARLLADQQRREAEHRREQEEREANAAAQEREWKRARDQIQKRAQQREAEIEQTRKEAAARQERRNSELEKVVAAVRGGLSAWHQAKEAQRAREQASQEERQRVLEERRAQQEARERERQQARAREEEELAQKREDARRQQRMREEELTKAREDREKARAKLKEELNKDDPFGFDSFRGPRNRDTFKERIFGAHFDFRSEGYSSSSSSRSQSRWRTDPRVYDAANDTQWEQFEAKNLQDIKMSDVPFPKVKSLHIGGTDFKKLAKRWHPDKFAQMFGSRLCASQKDAIMDKVKATFQALNDAR